MLGIRSYWLGILDILKIGTPQFFLFVGCKIRQIGIPARLRIVTITTRDVCRGLTPPASPETLKCGLLSAYPSRLPRSSLYCKRRVGTRPGVGSFGTAPGSSRYLRERHTTEKSPARHRQSARVLRSRSSSKESYHEAKIVS